MKTPETKREELQRLAEAYPDFSPYVLLKLSMVCHGVILSEEALDRLQSPLYSFGKVEPFGISFSGRKTEKSMPSAILLRDSSYVYINYGENYADPYRVDFDPDRDCFLLMDGDSLIDAVDFVPRPSFFGKTTSSGTPMEAIADVRAQKLILNAYQKCELWRGGDQCHFCAFFTGKHIPGEVSLEDIRETLREALKEPGRYSELFLSGGTDFTGEPAFKREEERYIRVLRAIGEEFSGRFPSQLMAPAYPKESLARIYRETGVTGYCPNIEVWDKKLFQRFCPGKDKWVGYDNWVQRTVDAVEVFGRGNVCTQVVAGVELSQPYGFSSMEQALDSNFEACDYFAKNGVIFLSTIWRPHRATRLGYQPMPPVEYYVRLAKGLHEIRRSYGLLSTNDDYKRCGNHPDADLERMD